MENIPPKIADDLPGKFALAIGKALQHFGTIEYLVNEVLSKLIADPLVHVYIIRLPISKRLEILDSYLKRDKEKLSTVGFTTSGFTVKISALFVFRNKIAHNPMVIKVDNATNPPSVDSIGIHVIRYNTDGKKEEWITHDEIERMVLESAKSMHEVNWLFSHYP